MLGQGAIIATGAIDYPAEYQAVTNDDHHEYWYQQSDEHHKHIRSQDHTGSRVRTISSEVKRIA
jgi:hypothetical protein